MKRIVLYSVFLCMIFAGISYGGWKTSLNMGIETTTGSFAMGFGSVENVAVFLVGADESRTEYKEFTVIPAVDSEGLLEIGLGSEEVPMDVTNFLSEYEAVEIKYDLIYSADSTRKAVAQSEAEDEVILMPELAQIAFKGDKLDLRDEERLIWAPTITLTGTKQYEDIEGGITVTHSFRLSDDTKQLLAQQQELLFPAGVYFPGIEAEEEELESLDMITEYQFVIPVNVQQS